MAGFVFFLLFYLIWASSFGLHLLWIPMGKIKFQNGTPKLLVNSLFSTLLQPSPSEVSSLHNSQLILLTMHVTKKKIQLPNFVSWDGPSSHPQSHTWGDSKEGLQAQMKHLMWGSSCGQEWGWASPSWFSRKRLGLPNLGQYRPRVVYLFWFLHFFQVEDICEVFSWLQIWPCLVCLYTCVLLKLEESL